MDFDMPSPSQFPSSSQWANACNQYASIDMNSDMDDGVVRWVASQSPFQRQVSASMMEEERESRPPSSTSMYTPTWVLSTSTSANTATRTASLPVFSASSSSSLPCRASGPSTSVFTSTRKLRPRKHEKKVPPSREKKRVENDGHVDPGRTEELGDLIGIASRKIDRNSRLKQARNEKAEKKERNGTSGDTVAWNNTISTFSSRSRFTFSASAAGPPQKAINTSTNPSSSIRSIGSSTSETFSSTIIEPSIKCSRDGSTSADVEMTTDSERGTDLEGSAFTDTPGRFTLVDALNESFSVRVDNTLPSLTKRTPGRTHSAATVSSTTHARSTISSNSGPMSSKSIPKTTSAAVATSSRTIPQTTHVHSPVLTPTTQRHPPPLGMRRPPNIPSTGLPASQSRYAATQSPYVASQTKGHKQMTLPPFKPPLLSKINPKPAHASKQSVQSSGSPPMSTPELDMDDDEPEGGGAVADSSFDVSFEVDRDALEMAMRQYD